MKQRKPIRIIFTKNGKPCIFRDGKIDEKLWTAYGQHWISSDGPFPYDDCETRYVEGGFGASIILATPPFPD